mmetsp:Transcript_20019/g.60506  ORF Transcript_20019/g.60506 Transcript_20019/m.60506 type:complete len:232 (-) Transcript_20019:151-846(-)
MPESTPHRRRLGGSSRGGCRWAGRHTSDSSRRGRPSAEAIWSITPQGAPTTWFSTCWHSRATQRGGIDSCSAAAKAVMEATSSAALLDTPAPAGTSDATRTARLGGGPLEPDWGPPPLDWGPLLFDGATPIRAAAVGCSCARASRPPATYAAQLREVSSVKRPRAARSDSRVPPGAKSDRGMSKAAARSTPRLPPRLTMLSVGSPPGGVGRSWAATWQDRARGSCSTRDPP